MNYSHVYYQLHQQFLLGNFHKVLEIFPKYQNLDFKEKQDEVVSIVCRSIIAFSERQKIETSFNQKVEETLKQVKPFLKDVYSNNNISQQENKIQNSHLRYFVQQLQEGINSNQKDLELQLITLIDFLRRNKKEQALKKLDDLLNANDEDIASHLGQIYLQLNNCKFSQACSSIDSLKEMISDSLKLMNLKAVALIGMQQYETAQNLLSKIVVLAQGKLKDHYELNVAQSNLLLINLVLAENQEIEIDEQSQYYKKRVEAEQMFDKALEKI